MIYTKANKQTSKQANKQTSKQANKQTSKQANKQTSKLARWHIDMVKYAWRLVDANYILRGDYMRMLSFYNKKGGVGKSTLCTIYANYFANNNTKVLVLDLDDQKNFSLYNGSNCIKNSFLDLLKGTCKPEDVVNKVSDNIHSIHMDDSNACELYLSAVRNSQREFDITIDLLMELDYEYILVDLPPSTSLVAFAALEKSDDIIIPFEPNNSSLKGIFDVLGMIKYELRLEDYSKIRQIIPNKYAVNKRSHVANMEYLREQLLGFEDSFIPCALTNFEIPMRENINRFTNNLEELNPDCMKYFDELVGDYVKNVMVLYET